MGTLNDEILRVTGGPTIPDGLRAYYLANGAVSGTLDDLERQFLIVNIKTLPSRPATNSDLWMLLSDELGYFGTLNDRLLAFWTSGGVIGGGTLGPELVTNGEFVDASGWTFQTGWSFNVDHAESNGNNAGALLQTTLAYTDNSSYRVAFDISDSLGTNAGKGLIMTLGNGPENINLGLDGPKLFLATNTTGSTNLRFFQENNNEFRGSIDNISVQLIIPA